MKATTKYNLSKIMKNAWYLKRANDLPQEGLAQ